MEVQTTGRHLVGGRSVIYSSAAQSLQALVGLLQLNEAPRIHTSKNWAEVVDQGTDCALRSSCIFSVLRARESRNLHRKWLAGLERVFPS